MTFFPEYDQSGSMNSKKPLSSIFLSRDVFNGVGKGTDLKPAIRKAVDLIHSAPKKTTGRHIFIIQ